MPIRDSEHTNEYIAIKEVRPDTTQAPTGMTVPSPTTKATTNDFGDPVVPGPSWNYLTQVSGNGRGETPTNLVNTVGVYTNTLKVSDRTAGPFEWVTQIADGSPITVSWLVNGRNVDSGTGAGLQPVEDQFERKDTTEQAFHNPTRDGNTSIAGAGPYAPNQTKRVHSGKPIYFSASGSIFKSCVSPLDFSFPGNPPLGFGHGFEHGENAIDTSAWWFGHRHYQQIELNVGGSAVMHKNTTWTYQPTAWNGLGDSDPTEVSRSCSHYCKVNYFNEARVYDLQAGTNVVVPNFAPTPGVNKFRTWNFNKDYFTDDNGVQDGSIPPTTTTLARSRYAAILLRNTVTDFCVAVAVRMSDDIRIGINSGQSTFLKEPSNLMLFSYAGAAATSIPEEQWAILMDPQCVSNRRRSGWIGVQEWIFVGRFATVTAAMTALKASGDMDLPVTTALPDVVTAGTVWPYPYHASSHKHLWALYDAVGQTPTTVATKLVLRAGQEKLHYIDDFGVARYPPPEVVYNPVAPGTTKTLTDCTSSVGGYLNKVSISNRHCGPLYWETECPDGFRKSWVMAGIFPSGSAMQTADAWVERGNVSDVIFSNPTFMGAGLTGDPSGGSFPPPDPYYTGDHPPVEIPNVRFKELCSKPIFLRVRPGIYEGAVNPIEFQGYGAGPNFTQVGYDSQNHGALDARPALYYGSKYYTRGVLNWRGMKTCHRTDYSAYHPKAVEPTGDSGMAVVSPAAPSDNNVLVFSGVLIATCGRFFDKAHVRDLQKGAAASAFELAEFPAPANTSWFPAWTFSTVVGARLSDIPPLPPLIASFPRSVYYAATMTNTTADFTVGLAVKLQEPSADGFTIADVDGRPTIVVTGQFEDDDSVGDINQAWGSFIFTQCKSLRRPKGWIHRSHFMFAGKTADVLADMDRLYQSGDMDLTGIVNYVPPEVRDGTAFRFDPVLTVGCIRDRARERFSGGQA